ncbi:nucleoside recognition domain-containing protein [Paenibacillus sp. FSL H8-0034]|uniref:nucleoside recognition domain-containing protein n=1 Tax=Paenibacillus sp. FSL H8-0034 TaxID=2954671 RepID=UPI0030F6073E
MLSQVKASPSSVVLIGFESSGKSSLFRGLTGDAAGEEANFRGSTVMSRKARLSAELELTDLPGIRLKDDSATTKLALEQLYEADTVVLVVRGTHAQVELPLLLDAVNLHSKKTLLLLTFEDKSSAKLHEIMDYYREWLGIPVASADSRSLQVHKQQSLIQVIAAAKPMRSTAIPLLAPEIPVVRPQTTWFEHRVWGRGLSLLVTVLIFAVPVYAAYLFSAWMQPIADQAVIRPLTALFSEFPAIIQAVIAGDYGILTLGWYSFLWAFPVVLLVGLSVGLVEESGLKDRITDALDGWLRYIGLNGRDLIPVLSGFGCNVVAVFQSRTCSACTRKSCVSMITYGSACSYQIGASLSIFGSAGRPWLFIPYLLVLFVVGTLHTRLWNGRSAAHTLPAYDHTTFLQKPTLRGVSWRVRAVIKQFVLQAMPIFILICLVATLLEQVGGLTWLAGIVGPLLAIFHLPSEAAPGILFSILRKDGLLILNEGNGSLLTMLSAGQTFLLVYLASTLTACLVTMWTIGQELGIRFAATLASKQVLTSVGSTLLLAWLFA